MTEEQGSQEPTRGFIAVPEGQTNPASPSVEFGPLTDEEREQFRYVRQALSGLDETLRLEAMRVMHDRVPRVALVAMKNVGDEILATPLALLIDEGLWEGMAQPEQEEQAGGLLPSALQDLLSLVEDEFPADMPRLATVEAWTPEVRKDVQEWAMAVHLVASDNDDVEIPPLPEVLRAD